MSSRMNRFEVKNGDMMNRIKLLAFIVSLLALNLTGCETLKNTSDTVAQPFTSKQRINLTPFAEQMIAMVGDLQFDLSIKQPIYIPHFSKTGLSHPCPGL
jgi:hypothetical protein